MEDWAEVNEEIADILKDLSRYGLRTLDFIELSEYQISLGVNSLRVYVTTAIELIEGGGRKVCELNADHRDRSQDSFRICRMLGEIVSSCTGSEAGLRIEMDSGLALLCRRDDDFENFEISYASPSKEWWYGVF